MGKNNALRAEARVPIIVNVNEQDTHHHDELATEKDMVLALEAVALGKTIKVKHVHKTGHNEEFGNYDEELIERTLIPPQTQALSLWLKNKGKQWNAEETQELKISWNETKTYPSTTRTEILENPKTRRELPIVPQRDLETMEQKSEMVFAPKQPPTMPGEETEEERTGFFSKIFGKNENAKVDGED